ncbi:MAG: DUF5683 domain-containing protein [Candidatus Poribacteria bacterium]|nr:DUF5683 domain-containing protein [Candidatus Poribacteria bacterium]
MKFNPEIIILILIFSLLSNMGLAAESLQAQPFTAFYLDSALGNRTLEDQSTVVMEATQELQTRKSPNEAFLYSLVVPGMGQLYTGAKRGYLYAAADVVLLTTYFVLRNSASNTREDYRDVVRQHVTFIGPGSFEDWDPIEDFEHATQYETWNHVYDSDATRARTGKWYWKDLDPNLKNEPDLNIDFDSRYRLEAFDLRQRANDTFQRARTILGMAILNHIVSAVEARISTKRFNTRLQRALTQTRRNGLEIDLQTDIAAGAPIGVLVLRKRF